MAIFKKYFVNASFLRIKVLKKEAIGQFNNIKTNYMRMIKT